MMIMMVMHDDDGEEHEGWIYNCTLSKLLWVAVN